MMPKNNQMGLKVLQERKPYVLPCPNASGLFSSEEWRNTRMGIPVMLGKAADGTVRLMDLAEAPHLLGAGATGSGKAAFTRQLFQSLLLRFSPDELKLLLIDPYARNFAPYEKVPHLVAPVLTDPEKVTAAFQWACKEMNRRFQWLAAAAVRDIHCYNNRTPSVEARCDREGNPIPDRMPYLVIVIGEFADLPIDTIEGVFCQLAAKSRAVGIRIVALTQCMSEDVLPGVLKYCFPLRFAFRGADKGDSLATLEQEGAELLRGKGDMLYSTGANTCGRIQCGYASSDEIALVVNACAIQREAEFDEALMKMLNAGMQEKSKEQESPDCSQLSEEELIQRALAVIATTKRPTISCLQRRLHIAFNQSDALLEKLEELGYVGPQGIERPREIHWDKFPHDIVSM